MKSFLARHAEKITGHLSFWDRLVFRGCLRKIAYVAGMDLFLTMRKIPFTQFGKFAEECSERLKAAALAAVVAAGRPVEYVPSSAIDKEARARQIAKADSITEGAVCVLTCVEPCMAYDIWRNRKQQTLDLVVRQRKCLHLYFYLIDPVFGWLNARIQTWFPFNVQICVNGREWLGRKLDEASVGYERRDNCFARIDDPDRAQEIAKKEFSRDWPRLLDRLARMLNPAHQEIFRSFNVGYYWTAYQSEWATDVMFRDAAALAPVASAMMRLGMQSFSSRDVMRFLHPKADRRFLGEIITDFKDRVEGRRLKFKIGQNSIKFYDKEGSVARVETTIQDPLVFKVARTVTTDGTKQVKLLRMRKGVADLYQRAQVSHQANERLLEAFATASSDQPLGVLFGEMAKPARWKGRRVRGIRAWDKSDVDLCRALNDGRFLLNGLRNRDLQTLLYQTEPASEAEVRKRRSRVTRLIRLMRAHGILQKIPRSHRYKVSPNGRLFLTAILETHAVTLDALTKATA